LEDTALVPRYCTVDGHPLGEWVSTQRQFKSKGTLDPDRQRRLEQVHPTWRWNADDFRWEFMFGLLERHIEENGDADVQSTYVTADGYPLGKWIVTQRNYYRSGVLDPERQKLLSKLAGWEWDLNAASWEFMFGLLERYIEENGDADVQSSYVTADGYPLGRWVRWQRIVY